MIKALFNRLRKDRKAATAVVMALMTVPLIISAGAAVDFSRISSARAQLQAATDSAAIAGAGAWQNSQSATDAANVANAMYSGTGGNLSNFVNIATGTPVVHAYCSGTPAQCGQATTTGTATGCPASYEYCVVVKANATLTNSLLGHWIPAEALNETSVGTTNFPTTNTVNQGSFTHTSVGFGSDLSGIYAYVVPEDSGGHPEYGTVPSPNSNCNSSTLGPVYYEQNKTTPAAGVTTCNYLLIGLSTGGSGSGSLTFKSSNPIAFSFVNFTGASASATDLDTSVSTSTAATAAVQNQSSAITLTGYQVVTPADCASTGKCTQYTNEIYYNNGSATEKYAAAGLTVSGKALFGYCPAHNLYGSINVYPSLAANIVPLQDSINTYSSAYMYLGYPPTHGTNHALLPFLGPVNTQVIAGATYTVQAVCPQWLTTGTNINATASFTPSTLSSAYAGFPTETVKVYSTYYPDQTYADTTGNIYPPAIAGCTPVTNGTTLAPGASVSATPNASSSNPWWGWSPSNAADYDPGDTSVHNCSFNAVSASGTMTTKTIATAALQASNGSNAPFNTGYNDCALIIQPLPVGSANLPDYYTYTANPSAVSGSFGNAAKVTAMTPVFDGTGSAGYVPTGFPNAGVTISSLGNGSYKVTEPPSGGTDHYPPEDTSHQCYNPQYNGIDANTLPSIDIPNNDSTPALPNDPVENAGLGALLCAANPPPSYALYWNDMGAYANPPQNNDDLGYANAVTEFTCPTPSVNSSGGSGPATLSD